MKMKKIAGMVGVCLMCVCALDGCGQDGSKEPADRAQVETLETKAGSPTEDVQAEESEDKEADNTGGNAGYVFESNGTEIVVDMDMSAVADKLGEPVNYYEEPSCAAQGIAKIYTYSGFEIETYPDGDSDLIACVVLKDDSVATPEGVDLSMTKEEIIVAYGSDYEESETSMVYEKNGTKLCFILDGEDIASIEYDSPVLN